MSCIRLDAITVDSGNELIIENGYVNIINTSVSTSVLSGALVINGGIGIMCSEDAFSATNGGSITIGGGMGISKGLHIGGNIMMDSNNGVFSIEGVIYPRLLIDTITNQNVSISVDGINQHFILNESSLYIGTSTNSLNGSTGALVIYGGVTIQSSSNSSSVTEGGGLTVAGGLSIGSNSYFGRSIFISSGSVCTNYITSLTNTLNISTGHLNISECQDFTFGNSLILNNSSSSFNTNVNIIGLLQVNDMLLSSTQDNALTILGGLIIEKDVTINGDLHLTSGLLYLSNNEKISVSSGNMILTASDSIILNSVSIVCNNQLSIGDMLLNSTVGNMYIQSYENGGNYINILTNTSDSLDDNMLNIYSSGSGGNMSNWLSLGYESSQEMYILGINTISSGSLYNFNISNTNGSLILTTSGQLNITTFKSPISLSVSNQLVIYDTSDTTTTSASLYVHGGVIIGKDIIINSTGNIYINSGNINTLNGITFANRNLNSFDLYSESTTSNLNVSLYANYYENDKFSIMDQGSIGSTLGYVLSSNSNRYILLNATTSIDSSQLYLDTTGNIGINTTQPSSTLDINGSLHCISQNVTNIVSSSISSGTLNIISMNCSNGISCGILNVNNQSQLYGSVTIHNVDNASLNSTYASLSISGGLQVSKDMILNGLIISNSSGTFNTLNLLSTNGNNNIYGTVTIYNSTNSINISSGSALSIYGGVNIIQDIYIGGKSYLYNNIEYTTGLNTYGNIMNIHDIYNIQLSITISPYT